MSYVQQCRCPFSSAHTEPGTFCELARVCHIIGDIIQVLAHCEFLSLLLLQVEDSYFTDCFRETNYIALLLFSGTFL